MNKEQLYEEDLQRISGLHPPYTKPAEKVRFLLPRIHSELAATHMRTGEVPALNKQNEADFLQSGTCSNCAAQSNCLHVLHPRHE